MKNKTLAGIAVIILGALLALIPILIFPVCNNKIELINGKTLFMKCHWSAMTELLTGALIVFNGILIIGFKNRETQIALGITLFLLGLAALLVPTVVIGMCESSTMPCRLGTEPALIVVSTIIMAFGIGNTLFQAGSIKSERYNERSVLK